MKNQFLNGVADAFGYIRTFVQLQFFAIMANAKNLFKPEILQMLGNTPKFERKSYYLVATTTGGAGQSTDLLANLPASEKIGYTNIVNKKINDNEAFIADRFELEYASSTSTDAEADVIPTLTYDLITTAPAGILNGEIEFLLNDKRIVRVPVSKVIEPVEGTLDTKKTGFHLSNLPLIQSNEIIGAKLYTAAALSAAGGLKHYVRFNFSGEAARSKV